MYVLDGGSSGPGADGVGWGVESAEGVVGIVVGGARTAPFCR